MDIYEYGNEQASVVLIEMVGEHNLPGIEQKIIEIRRLIDMDFRFIAVKVNNWNQDLSPWNAEAVFGTEKGLDYNHFLGGSTISADKKTMYLFVYDKPQETLCVKGIKTPVKRVTVLHTGEELRFSYTGSLPWSGIPGTLWIWAGEMSIHPFATVVKVELEDEITYNLGHGEVVTFNE